MKSLVLLLFIPFGCFSQIPNKKVSALFLGNSYTFYNYLPALISDIAKANGDSLFTDGNNPGGYTFGNHFSDANSKAKINTRAWDYVVLQAQSQEPSFPPTQVNSQTMPYAIKLDSLIKENNSCSNTVFYETWGRKNGDAANCGFYPPLCTYNGMQNRLRISYKKFADTTNGIMAPAGEAFRKSILADPSLELYDQDQSHPSLNGSYLTACVFYEILFQKSVLTNTFNPGVSANTLSFLQQIAHSTINDSLGTWNLGTNLPWAAFKFNQTSGTGFQFQSVTTGSQNLWHFGDGSTSALANPTHNYTGAGNYVVSHVVSDGCKKDSSVQTISVVVSGVKGNMSDRFSVTLYPNPCSNILQIQNSTGLNTRAAQLEISNAIGQIVYKSDFKEELVISELKNGLYFLKVFDANHSNTVRFIKGE